MAAMVWTDEIVENLISMYQERPCLYDIKTKDYFNRDKRNKALSEIADSLGTRSDVIKAKLKSIRTIYTRERQKTGKRKTGTGVDDVYVTKFPHYEQLQFLNDFISAKRSISNLQDNDSEGNCSKESEITTDSNSEDKDYSENKEISEEEEMETPKSTKRPLKLEKRLTKRKKEDARDNELIEKAIQCMDRAASSTDDCLEVFGRYVTSELRAVKNIQAQRWAKLQIQNILFSAQSEAQQSHPMPQHYQYYEPFRNPHMTLASHSLSMNEPWSPTPSFASPSHDGHSETSD